MAILTKAQLEALNQSSFPDQSTEAITPAILRNYNTQTIDTLVDSLDTGSFTTDVEFNAFTSSTNSSITQLNAATASYDAKFATIGTQSGSWGGGGSVPAGTVSSSAQIVELGFQQTSSFNSYTASTNSSITQLNASSASQQISINNLNSTTASINSSITQLNASSASQQISINALNAATSSYVTSAITASSVVDIFNTLVDNQFTYTKGDGSQQTVTLNSSGGGTIPAGTVSSSAQILAYNIFATTGSNTFTGNQNIEAQLTASALRVENNTYLDGTLTVTNDTTMTGDLLIQSTSPKLKLRDTSGGGFSSGYDLTIDTGSFIINDETHDRPVLSDIYNPSTLKHTTELTSEIIVISGSESVTIQGALTASLADGYAWVGNGSGLTSQVATSSFGGGGTINTSSFATTGSNVFTAEQTLVDAAGNTVTLDDISGSLVLVSKGVTSGSAGLSHITASANNQVNIIFKNNNQLSGSTTLSGSNNILQSPPAPTAGFRRQAGASNIMITGQIPEISSSVTFPVAISGNYANSIIRLRGPVSSSGWGINNNIVNGNFNVGNADATSANQAIAGGAMNNNILLAAVNYNAYTTPLVTTATFSNNLSVGNTTLTAFSSSIQAQFNIFNGNTFTINNRYFGTSSTNAAQRLALSYNVLGGVNSCTLTASGSNTTAGAAREVVANTSNGSGNQIGVVLNGDNSNLYSTLIYGNNLIVTGSSLFNTYANGGGAFIGRNNAVDGTKAYSSETIFAVGTGTSTATRKTGFLIDSGSNTFVDGTFNVTGPTSLNGAVNITGSLTSSLTEGYVWVGGAGNISTLVATSSFSGVTSAITASSLITASVNLNTITFTKGDSSTFAITVDTGSGGGGSVPEGTVSSSAQILGYNIFATTGSNTFTGAQTINSGGGLVLGESTGANNNLIKLASLNQSTLYVQNSTISSGYASGSVLQLTAGTGSNGFGGSGSAVFQMDAVYEGNSSALKVGTAPGLGSYVQGFADKIEFAKAGGFPNTPATTFRVDAASIELSGSVKMNTGSSGSAGIVSIASGGTVNNGLVTSNSIILVTTQELGSGQEYPASVSGKTNGSFQIDHNFGGNLSVAYLIINPI
jgi:hypothetical protein